VAVKQVEKKWVDCQVDRKFELTQAPILQSSPKESRASSH